jgi:hypothetical protein
VGGFDFGRRGDQPPHCAPRTKHATPAGPVRVSTTAGREQQLAPAHHAWCGREPFICRPLSSRALACVTISDRALLQRAAPFLAARAPLCALCCRCASEATEGEARSQCDAPMFALHVGCRSAAACTCADWACCATK